jgi:hypothetical protein
LKNISLSSEVLSLKVISEKKTHVFFFNNTMGFFAKVETFCCHVFFSTIDVFLALGHNFLLYVEACNRINTQFLGSLEL